MGTDIFFDIELAKNGDKDAQARLVTGNMGLVHSVARRFAGRGHEYEDLCQIGAIGLIKAVQKFDASFEVRFSTYAVPMILGEIKRFIRDDGAIKVSRGLKELSARARQVQSELRLRLGREPSVAELAGGLGVEPAELAMALESAAAPDSLNAAEGDGNRELLDRVDDKTDTESAIVDRLAVQDALALLAPRERQIIVLRYFQHKTQMQIAAMLGISQVQVSRIEKKVLGQLRRKMSAEGL